MPDQPHSLDVDCTEHDAALLQLARACAEFDVRMKPLEVGDYIVADAVAIERKTFADFATSLVDGRLFPQVAALARSPLRPLVLLEGPRPPQMPDVHVHALRGAVASIAVMWRVPVICTRNPDESIQLLRTIANQVHGAPLQPLKQYQRKPKRQKSRRLHVLQGLPGIGPALAGRLLQRFGSIEAVMIADAEELAAVEGVGLTKAARIRELVGAPQSTARATDAAPSQPACHVDDGLEDVSLLWHHGRHEPDRA